MKSRKIFQGWQVLLCGFLIPLLFAPTARAENQVLPKAIAAYESFEFQEALRLLEQALLVTGSTTQEQAQVHLYLGLVRFTLGDRTSADREFREALKLDYDVKLPADSSPKITTRFEEIKKTIPPPAVKPPPGQVTPPPPPTVVTEGPRKRVWTWVLMGVGCGMVAIGGVGGGTFGYLASQAKSDFDKEPWADKANSLKSTAESRAQTANILFGVGLGVGGAMVVGAVIAYFLEGGGETTPAEPSKVNVTASPLGFEASVKF